MVFWTFIIYGALLGLAVGAMKWLGGDLASQNVRDRMKEWGADVNQKKEDDWGIGPDSGDKSR